MKAIIVHGAGDLRVEDVATPQPGSGEVLVRIIYGGICGSDMHYASSGRNGTFTLSEPLVLGHEVVGVVAEVGPGANGEAGMPVAIHPATPTPTSGSPRGTGLNLAPGGTYLGSASTMPHTQGGFAEYVVVTSAQLRPLPREVPLRRGVLAEPLAVAVHGVGLLGSRVDGARALVSGAGPIGVLATSALRHAGAAHITVADLHKRPLETAAGVGADATVQIGVDEPVPADSFDIVVESAGVVNSLATALSSVRRGGAILQLGILPPGELPIPLAPLVAKEVLLQGAQRFDVEMDEALELLAQGPRIEEIISHEYLADDAVEAFACAADAQRSGKVILCFAPESSA